MASRPQAAEPAVGQVVGSARDKLLALARIAHVTGDPAAPVLEAQIAMLDAQYRLFEETKPAAEFTDKQVEDIGKRMVRSCQTWAGDLLKAEDRKSVATHLGAVLLALGVGFGAGCWYWHATTQKPLNPLATNCHPVPQPAGGEAYACTFWTHTPTPGVH